MADIAVRLFLPKLQSLIGREWKLLANVQQSIKDAKYELESMLQVLREADAKGDNKAWVVKQAREAVYDIEDIIDEFALRIGQTHGRGIIANFLQIFHIAKNGYHYHLVGVHLLEIKERVRKISDWNKQGQPGMQTEQETGFDEHPTTSLFVNEEDIVGMEKPRDVLTGWLLNKELSRNTLSVLGMGGLGKTTLVKRVYDGDQVKKQFQSHAWISIAQQSKTHELLENLIKHLFEESKAAVPEGLDAKKDAQLIEIIQNFLREKRYIVVLDNLMSTTAWESLKCALLDNKLGSRIMVSTRIEDVANSCVESSCHAYRLDPLDEKDSWNLFCKKAFPSELHGQCPPHLELLSRKIMRRCGGMPLAITVVAGLLPKTEKERTVVRWQKFHDSLTFKLATNPNLKNMGKALMLGYNELPYYLKPCFLYFSVFPRGRRVKCMRLFRLWIAEGFIEEKQNVTLEDVAEAYLNELINRNMVQVAKFDCCGRARSCQIHDVVWDVLLSKSQEENFSSSLDTKKSNISERIRRLSIQTRVSKIQTSTDLSHIRSFFVFGTQEFSSSSASTLFSGFRLLKVLDLKGAGIEAFPSQIVDLFFLRYLSLRSTKVSVLPKSIGKLRNLQTLDLKNTPVSELPDEILCLQNLRHLLTYHYKYEQGSSPIDSKQGVKIPPGIDSLDALQKLSYIDVSLMRGVVSEFGELTQLRRIGITELRREDGRDLCMALEEMNQLLSIYVRSAEGESLDLQSLQSPPPMLQRLYLVGRQAKLPLWILRAPNLVKLRLSRSRLKEDPFAILQHLPNLAELYLLQAYEGKELHCNKGGFRRLEILELDMLANLQEIRLGEGAMLELLRLVIQRCGNLRKVPIGLERLTSLKEFYSFGMPEKYIKAARSMVRRQKKERGVHIQEKQRIPLAAGRYHALLDDEDLN